MILSLDISEKSQKLAVAGFKRCVSSCYPSQLQPKNKRLG